MNRKKRNLLITLTTLSVVMALAFTSAGYKSDKYNFQIAKNLDIFFSLFRELNIYYVDSANPEKLIEAGIEGMLESLDPYTTYIPESDMDDFRFMTTGEYGGIGALISKRDSLVLIAEPYPGFPAFMSGLRAGDTIYTIDGTRVLNMNTSDVSELLKGVPATDVEVVVRRFGESEPVKFTITREKIQINPVAYYGVVDGNVGYIMLTNFTDNCSDEIEKALKDLKENHGISSLILDLRSNPGGLLNEAVKVTNLFIPKGEIVVSTRGKIKQSNTEYKTRREPVDTEIPLAVLVNSSSASASEIVSGALQDLDRAVILGERTFGKGLVQTTRNLSYNAKLKVTTAKYYIPSDRCIQAVDYSNRNEDGSVGKIPDSLIHEFKTRNGRIVYDGGGIRPDIDVENDDLSNIAVGLLRQRIIFDYATQFYHKNRSIPLLETFSVSDSIYNDFKTYIADIDFDYTTQTEKELNELIKAAKREKYYDIASEDLSDIQNLLVHDVKRDVDHFRSEISDLLLAEIVNRYYHRQGEIQKSLERDKVLEEAVEVLKERSRYVSILSSPDVVVGMNQ